MVANVEKAIFAVHRFYKHGKYTSIYWKRIEWEWEKYRIWHKPASIKMQFLIALYLVYELRSPHSYHTVDIICSGCGQPRSHCTVQWSMKIFGLEFCAIIIYSKIFLCECCIRNYSFESLVVWQWNSSIIIDIFR